MVLDHVLLRKKGLHGPRFDLLGSHVIRMALLSEAQRRFLDIDSVSSCAAIASARILLGNPQVRIEAPG
jgi:hypothetical protein